MSKHCPKLRIRNQFGPIEGIAWHNHLNRIGDVTIDGPRARITLTTPRQAEKLAAWLLDVAAKWRAGAPTGGKT